MISVINKIAERIENRVFYYKENILKRKSLAQLKQNANCKTIILHNRNEKNYLSSLCDKYGSDKGELMSKGHPYIWLSHSYTDYYSRLLEQFRYNIQNVFECGIGSTNPNIPTNMGNQYTPGASLRVWMDYFPNANIFGADIDRNVLFEEKRIKTFYVDQTNSKSIIEMWNEIGVENIDFILDDGLHTFDAGCCLFENSISKLSKNGIYIIEDVQIADLLMYQTYFSSKEYLVDYVILHRKKIKLTNNNLVVIKRQ